MSLESRYSGDMAIKRMKSDQVRRQWRDVLDYVRHGGTVVVEHYQRPVAIITPYQEDAEQEGTP